MRQLSLDCPRCRTRAAAFSPAGFYGAGSEAVVLLRCSACDNGIVGRFMIDPDLARWLDGGELRQRPDLIEISPRAEAPRAPAHTPQNISSFYLQGGLSLFDGHYDAAGAMFRKCLDAALRYIDPAGRGTLEKRIDGLPECVGLTPAMKDWAHAIRKLGNDAVHEQEPFDRADAEDLGNFVCMFLTYAFTLPGMIAERRRKELAK